MFCTACKKSYSIDHHKEKCHKEADDRKVKLLDERIKELREQETAVNSGSLAPAGTGAKSPGAGGEGESGVFPKNAGVAKAKAKSRAGGGAKAKKDADAAAALDAQLARALWVGGGVGSSTSAGSSSGNAVEGEQEEGFGGFAEAVFGRGKKGKKKPKKKGFSAQDVMDLLEEEKAGADARPLFTGRETCACCGGCAADGDSAKRAKSGGAASSSAAASSFAIFGFGQPAAPKAKAKAKSRAKASPKRSPKSKNVVVHEMPGRISEQQKISIRAANEQHGGKMRRLSLTSDADDDVMMLDQSDDVLGGAAGGAAASSSRPAPKRAPAGPAAAASAKRPAAASPSTPPLMLRCINCPDWSVCAECVDDVEHFTGHVLVGVTGATKEDKHFEAGRFKICAAAFEDVPENEPEPAVEEDVLEGPEVALADAALAAQQEDIKDKSGAQEDDAFLPVPVIDGTVENGNGEKQLGGSSAAGPLLGAAGPSGAGPSSGAAEVAPDGAPRSGGTNGPVGKRGRQEGDNSDGDEMNHLPQKRRKTGE